MSLNKRLRAMVGALVTLILFVVVPYTISPYLPPYISQLLAQSEFELQGFLNQIMILGAVTAAMTLVKGFVSEASKVSLVISVAQNLASLVFTAMLLGIGNMGSLGITYFTVRVENTTSHIAMNLRVFIYFTVLIVGLRVVEAYLVWDEARIEAMPPGRIPP